MGVAVMTAPPSGGQRAVQALQIKVDAWKRQKTKVIKGFLFLPSSERLINDALQWAELAASMAIKQPRPKKRRGGHLEVLVLPSSPLRKQLDHRIVASAAERGRNTVQTLQYRTLAGPFFPGIPTLLEYVSF